MSFPTPLEWVVWTLAGSLVLALLILDLFVFHRKAREVPLREAAIWSALWIALGLGFGLVVWWSRGGIAATEYITAYLIEESLSIDNLFVFALIFSFFGLSRAYQHRVLFWGIVGSIFFRAVFIVVGASLLDSFHWMVYLFGALLVFTGVRMALHSETDVHPERNPILRLIRRFIPMTSSFHGQRFFIREHGRAVATPLFAVLVVVATTDVMFAIDSIPSVFAITTDPFLVLTSNVAAVLGLRSLYFLLAGMMGRFAYLNYALATILVATGAKFLISDLYHVPVQVSLAVIAGALIVAVFASWRWPPDPGPRSEKEGAAMSAVGP